VPGELNGLRVLLVHEWLYTWAGSERVLEQLSDMLPDADILAGIVTAEMRDAHAVAARARETWLGRIPGARTHHRWFLPLYPIVFNSFDARAYDLIISISHSFGKSVRARNDAHHFCYCLTPPRYLWDLRQAHEALATPPQRIALKAFGGVLREADRRAAAGVAKFASISRCVAERVRRCYGRESRVIYPPVRAKVPPAVRPRGREAYLLSLGRLVPYKRVDLAIRAAERLQMRIVVAGDGPERSRLERAGGRYTEFRGAVSEEEAAALIDGCAAFVFCAEEDFGIAPIEANAHGRPVVAFRAGGATETLVEGSTAVFFDQQDELDVAAAIERCLAASWDGETMKRHAERFAPAHFRNAMRSALAEAMALP
jgi:glycosyltransferase involved in cell wall biosynthesis